MRVDSIETPELGSWSYVVTDCSAALVVHIDDDCANAQKSGLPNTPA